MYISVTARIDAGLLRTLVEEKRDRRLAELASAYEERTSLTLTLQYKAIGVNVFRSRIGACAKYSPALGVCAADQLFLILNPMAVTAWLPPVFLPRVRWTATLVPVLR